MKNNGLIQPSVWRSIMPRFKIILATCNKLWLPFFLMVWFITLMIETGVWEKDQVWLFQDMHENFIGRASLILGLWTLWYGVFFKKVFREAGFASHLSTFLFNFTLFWDEIANIGGWFVKYSWFDNIIHSGNTGLYVIVAFLVIKEIFPKSDFALWVITGFLISQFLGSTFEAGEYYTDLWTGTNMVWSIEDVITDLVWNMSGGIVAVLIILISNKY